MCDFQPAAIGVPGSLSPENPVEIKAPFEAFLEDFDDEPLMLRTRIDYCLKVSSAGRYCCACTSRYT